MRVIPFPNKRPTRATIDEIAAKCGAESVTIHYMPKHGYLVGLGFASRATTVGTGPTLNSAMKRALEQIK